MQVVEQWYVAAIPTQLSIDFIDSNCKGLDQLRGSAAESS